MPLKKKKIKNKTKNQKRSLFKTKKNKKLVFKKLKRKKIRRKTKTTSQTTSQTTSPKNLITKHETNPIVAPIESNNWECWQTFNPGVILLDNRVHFLYRAIGYDGISRLGYASSLDGFLIDERLNYPVYEHKIQDQKLFPKYFVYSFLSGGSFGGAEDPRLTRVEDEDQIYMTYTACDNGLRIGLTSIKVSDFLNKKWNWARPQLISPPGQVHKNWVIFPEKINGQYAILHSLSPEIGITYRHSLEFKEGEFIESYYNGRVANKNSWDNWIRGAGAPPLKTKLGWLVFYHAMTNGEFNKYKVGALILDYKNPSKILLKSPFPILEPTEEYEWQGFKGGVVYVTGAIIKDGQIFVYYGAADSCIGLAYCNLDEFLNALKTSQKPPSVFKKVRIKK